MAEQTKTILPFVKSFKGFRRKRRNQGPVTALEVEGTILRVVSATPRGSRLMISRIAAERLELVENADRSNPAVMGAAIAKALERLRIKPGAVVMGVPRASVVLRTLTLPLMTDVREMASMVHFQMGKDLPFRLDEAVIDFKVRRELPASAVEEPSAEKTTNTEPPAPAAAPKMLVLVVAMKREVVEFYRSTAAAAGLNLVGLGLVSHANARCLAACRVREGKEVIALVSLRHDEVGIDIVGEDGLVFSRGMTIQPRTEPVVPGAPSLDNGAENPGSVDLTVPAEKQDSFVEAVTIEVVRSLHSYTGLEPHRPVSKIVVVGATEQEPEVVEALQYRLNLTCTWLDVASDLELPKAAREHAAASISAIGLALSAGDPRGMPFDFLNPKRPAVKRNMKRLRAIMAIAGVAALLISVVTVRSYLIKQHLNVKAQTELELKEAEKKRPIYKAMIGQAASIKEWTGSAQNWLEHYAYLTAILPSSEEIYLTSLSVSGQGTIRMAVQARSGEILAKLDKQLRAAGYDVKPIAITPGNDRFGYDFRTSVELIVPEKMKIDLAKVRAPARPPDDGSMDPAVYRKGRGR